MAFCKIGNCLKKAAEPRDFCWEHWISETYPCPYCHAKAGEPCIDVRVHRARKMQDPGFRERERGRSAMRARRRR